VSFAESVGATICAPGHGQFCLRKTEDTQFRFVDTTGKYKGLELRNQLTPPAVLQRATSQPLRSLAGMIRSR